MSSDCSYTKINIAWSSSTQTGVLLYNTPQRFSIFYKTGTRKVGDGVGLRDNSPITMSIISGFLYGIDLLSGVPTSTLNTPSITMFKDCENCLVNISNTGAPIVWNIANLSLYNCNYLFYNTNKNTSVKFNTSTLYGYPTSAIYNPSSADKSFVNLTNGTCITGLGVYPEYQQNQSVTLENNSTDSISIGDKSYNRSIEIKYNITRGTDYRTGTLKILNTGTLLLFDPGDYIQTADLGVTFNGAYYSGGSNTIKLKLTTTNTGTAATLQYDANRQNY